MFKSLLFACSLTLMEAFSLPAHSQKPLTPTVLEAEPQLANWLERIYF